MLSRSLKGLVCALSVVVLVLLGGVAPASAADPLPPPVDPLPTHPGAYTRALSGSGTFVNDAIGYSVFARQQQAAMIRAAQAVGPAPVIPLPETVAGAKTAAITGVRALSAGSIVTGAFMSGWLITDGTLAMYAAQTGTNPLQNACGWGDFGVATVQVLYPISQPDCSVTIDNPNAGIPSITELALTNGYTAKYNGSYTHWSGSKGICFTASRATGYSGYALRVHYRADNQGTPGGNTTWHVQFGGGWQGGCPTYGWPAATHDLAGHSPVTFDVIRNSDSAVMGTSTTTTADPLRTPSCQLKWPGGSTTTVNGTEAQRYQESAGLPLATFSALCNDGFVSKPGHGPDLLPSEITIGSTRVDAPGEPMKEIQKQTVPEFTPDEKKGLTGPTTGGGLVLQRVVGTTINSCMNWSVNCANWWATSNSGTDETVDQDYYRCLYNGQQVALKNCSPYQTTFDTQTSTPTITDPATGTPQPWTNPNPSTGTQTGTFPSTGANPGAATSTATGGGGCTAGWSWNPVDWVLNPLRCAFIPSTASVTGTIAGLGAAAGSIAAVDPLLTLMGELPTGSGCDGLPIVLTFFGQTFEGRLLEACSGPGAAAAAVVNGLLTLALCTASVFAIGRYAAAVFGFVGPGGQMEHAQRSTDRELDRIARTGGGGRHD